MMYEEAKMVVMATSVNTGISLPETKPACFPVNSNTNPNSLTWAAVKPDKKLFRRVNFMDLNRIYKMRGLPMRIKVERIIPGNATSFKDAMCIWLPRTIKKSTRKKSLSGLMRLAISGWYGDAESEIPATIAPISRENPSQYKRLATPKHQVMVKRNRNSLEEAMCLIILGRIYFAIPIIAKIAIIPLRISGKNAMRLISLLPVTPSTTIIVIAMRSWTSITPMVYFPYTVSVSFLSASSFRMIIVLEKVIATATNNADARENPRKLRIIVPRIAVNRT